MTRIVLFSLLAALVVFCSVQDRVTAAAARRYVVLQRTALASATRGPGIDEVMQPAIRRSVRQGLMWGGVAMIAGLAAPILWRRVRE